MITKDSNTPDKKHFQKLTRVVPGSFNSQELIDDYLNEKKLPAIHENFRHVIRQCAPDQEASMDLGSCIGMICLALAEIKNDIAIGIEGNTFDFNRALKTSLCSYHNFYVNPDNFPILGNIIVQSKVKLITARRVISEIGFFDPGIVTQMAKLFYESGVKHIILEGRSKVKNPVALLHNTDLEAACFLPMYVEVYRHKQVAYLQKRAL